MSIPLTMKKCRMVIIFLTPLAIKNTWKLKNIMITQKRENVRNFNCPRSKIFFTFFLLLFVSQCTILKTPPERFSLNISEDQILVNEIVLEKLGANLPSRKEVESILGYKLKMRNKWSYWPIYEDKYFEVYWHSFSRKFKKRIFYLSLSFAPHINRQNTKVTFLDKNIGSKTTRQGIESVLIKSGLKYKTAKYSKSVLIASFKRHEVKFNFGNDSTLAILEIDLTDQI